MMFSSLKICGLLPSRRGVLKGLSNGMQKRSLSIHEYLSMSLLEENNIPVPRGNLIRTLEDVKKCFDTLKTDVVVLKAQVLTGGRGRGHFENGLQGGVQVVKSVAEAQEKAKRMIGHKIITKQTGEAGRMCEMLYGVEKLDIKREYYFAITLDRSSAKAVIISSTKGGVDIEKVAEESPDSIFKHFIDIKKGFKRGDADLIAETLGFGNLSEEAATVFENLYKVFCKYDSTMVEINPLAIVINPQGEEKVICMDAKISIDDNADFRQKKVFSLRDLTQEDQLEVQASKWDLNYIRLNGNIGCMVNGAGLAMATMDVIKLYGGEPANFLDIGGTAQEEQVVEAFKVLTADKNTKAILVNIFGGIVRCDIVADGIIAAAKKINISVPLVVRLRGTRVDEAKEKIVDSKLNMHFFDDFELAAKKVVELAKA